MNTHWLLEGGGYQESTHEKWEAFAKKRNKSYEEIQMALVAKAAGFVFVGWDSYCDEWICYDEETDCNFLWNPKERDGDAFRLAISLRLSIIFRTGILEVGSEDGVVWNTVSTRGVVDFQQLVRETIFLTAIEIGKGN